MSDSPIFIVGCGRSGTTLLRLILNRHSHISIPEETWFFPNLYRQIDVLVAVENWREEVVNYIISYTRIHFPDLTKEEVLGELNKYDEGDTSSIIAVVNKFFARKDTKARWGDKTPGYVLHLPFLKKIYPNAKVIHIIRDGRDVVPSILKYWEVGPQTNSFIETARYWKKHVTTGRVDGPEYFGENYFEVKYENLATNPIEFTKRICTFIEEEFEPGMLDTEKVNSGSAPNWDWHKKTNEKISNDRIGQWKKSPNSYQLTIMNYVGKNIFKEMGYENSRAFNLKAMKDICLFLIKKLLLWSKTKMYWTLKLKFDKL